MTDLSNLAPNASFGDLLTTTNGGQGLSDTLEQLQDGFGNPSTITISKLAVNFQQTSNAFQLNGIALTASATDINNVCQPNGTFTGTGALKLPGGTTGQRPGSPQVGDIRYNSTTDTFEGFKVSGWVTIA